MKTANLTILSPHFSSRNSKIRKADDFVRKVNINVPALSTSYANTFWGALDAKKYPENHQKFAQIAWTKINKCRDEYKKTNKNFKNPIDILKATKKYKAGNCFEKSFLTLGALYANGFYDAIGTQIALHTEAIDKNTGKIVFNKNYLCDHYCITANFNKKPKDMIILDPWFNKAMSYSEATDRYITLIGEQEIAKITEKFEKEFVNKNTKHSGLFNKKNCDDFNLSNYDFRQYITFKLTQDCFQFENIINRMKFGKLVAKEFPELIFK